MSAAKESIAWLMGGDPAIRWRTLRDLEDAPSERWQAERRLTLAEGWGARLLGLQSADGSWGGGIYSPKWTSTTYTLLTLIDIGIPPDHPPARAAAELVLERQLGAAADAAFHERLAACDRCIVGMDLEIAAYFGIADDRVDAIVENLLVEKMADGGWNCRRHRKPLPHHSSLHTTLNALEGLREWLETAPGHPLRGAALAAEENALEFLLEHRLYKSDKTGRIIHPKFTQLSFPPRWHYDLLRGLAYCARSGSPRDSRCQDAIDLLLARRAADGAWPLENRYSGKVFFEMEKLGKPSRWNTLRALRVLRWWSSTERAAYSSTGGK